MPTNKFFSTLLKFIAGAVLIFIPLYPKFPLFFLPSSTVAVRAEDFLLLISGITLIFYLYKNTLFKKIPLFLPLACLFLVGLLSSLSAVLITQNISKTLVFLHFFRRFEYLFVFYLFFFAAKESYENRRFLFELMVAPFLGVFGYGLAQIYLKAPVISTMNMESSKGIALTLQPGVQLSSTFAGHYDLAIYLAMLVIIFFTSFCLVKKNSWRVVILTADLLAVWLFMRAGSRIGILGLVATLVIMSFLLKKLRFGAIFILIVLGMMFTSSNLLMRMNNLLNVIKLSSYSIVPSVLAIEDRAIQADRSTSIRLDVEWPNAIRALIKNPLLGTGYSSLGLATDSDYLRSLGETGLMGFAALALFLIGIGKGLIRSYKQKLGTIDQIIVTSTLGIFIFYLICALFLDVFESSKIAILFWSYCGISFGIYSKKA